MLGQARGTKTINEVERRDGKTLRIGRIGGIVALRMKSQTFVITVEVDESSGTMMLEVQEDRATSQVLQEGPRA